MCSTSNIRFEVTTIRVPWTQVKKWGMELSNPCILELNSCMIIEGQMIGMSQRDSQLLLLMTVSKSIAKKSERMTRHYEWMPHQEKVIRKHLTGFIITQPDLRRSRINRGRRWCPGTKRVPGWSRLVLRCHTQTNREKERERSRRVTKQYQYQKDRKERYVCMTMWHAIIKTSWA